MISKKLYSILMIAIIISGFTSFLLLYFYTIPNETIDYNYLSMSELLNLNYLNNHPRFNYIHGLWLAPIGIIFFCIIGLLEIPKRNEDIKFKILVKIIKRKKG